MLKPLITTKQIKFSEDDWFPIYYAAKQKGLSPVEFIKAAAITAAKQAVNP